MVLALARRRHRALHPDAHPRARPRGPARQPVGETTHATRHRRLEGHARRLRLGPRRSGRRRADRRAPGRTSSSSTRTRTGSARATSRTCWATRPTTRCCVRPGSAPRGRSSPRSTTTRAASTSSSRARTLNPHLFVIARSRTDDAEPKFVRAGADRVVNPQRIGGNRIAAFAESPDVVDFLDVVMHDGQPRVPAGRHRGARRARRSSARRSPTPGPARAAARSCSRCARAGRFVTNPVAEHRARTVGDVLIVVGTDEQIDDLHRQGRGPVTRRLVVLRHAKSAYPPGVVDHDRPLAPRGVVDATAAGAWIRDHVGVPRPRRSSRAPGAPEAPGPSPPAAIGYIGAAGYDVRLARPARRSTRGSTRPAVRTLLTVLRELPGPGRDRRARRAQPRLRGPRRTSWRGSAIRPPLRLLAVKYPTAGIAVLDLDGRVVRPRAGRRTALHLRRAARLTPLASGPGERGSGCRPRRRPARPPRA